MTLEWIPPANYVFPECVEGKQKRRFLYKYLKLFPWLAYSRCKEGAFCKYCVVFAFAGGGVGQQVIMLCSNLYQYVLMLSCYNLSIIFIFPRSWEN